MTVFIGIQIGVFIFLVYIYSLIYEDSMPQPCQYPSQFDIEEKKDLIEGFIWLVVVGIGFIILQLLF